MRPVNHLNAASKLYPNAWKQVEDMLQAKGKDLPDWPDWCFLPLSGWYAIVSSDAGMQRLTPKLVPDVARLGAIGTWRYSQGIYRFDPDLYAALIGTEITGDIPVEVLYRLPEFCIYVETPGLLLGEGELFGFWCHLESDTNNGRTELRLLLDTEGGLLPQPLHMGNWSLIECLNRADDEISNNFTPDVWEKIKSLRDKTHTGEMAKRLQPLLSLILYLCSDEPEVDDSKQPGKGVHKPCLTKTRNGFKLFPPDRPRIWSVGTETGVKLREFTRSSRAEGHTVRPHIRRPHWHGYWTGPKQGERRFSYRWIPAILVGKA